MSGATDQRLSLFRIILFSLSHLFHRAGRRRAVRLSAALSASHVGLSLGVIGGVWASVRGVDLFLDPVLGHAMDRTDTRFGR